MRPRRGEFLKQILVTGAGGSAGINFVASLRMAEEPLRIVGADINRWHLELPDVDSAYVVPRCSDPLYINYINRVIRKERIELVHAQPDMELEVISDHRDELDARTFLPDAETVRYCHDKIETNRRLRMKGVPAPDSFLVDKIGDLPSLLGKLRGPSGIVWVRAVRGAGSRAALPVRTVRQAREWIHYWRTMRALESRDFMISEYLPGREFAFQSLWNRGELVTSQARERLEYVFGNLSPSGQSSSPSVAVTVSDDRVNAVSESAIRAITSKPHGVFCVDLKENVQGVPAVTEINVGRFFTTSNFFAKLGCNMPYMMVCLAFDERIPDLPRYNAVPPGYMWIRLMDAGPILVGDGTWRSQELSKQF